MPRHGNGVESCKHGTYLHATCGLCIAEAERAKCVAELRAAQQRWRIEAEERERDAAKEAQCTTQRDDADGRAEVARANETGFRIAADLLESTKGPKP